MRDHVQVRWTVIAQTPPRPWVSCSGCGRARPFQPTGKARLNANGRRLDAWLVYRCTTCQATWNRPVFRRRDVRDVDPSTLAALHANDPAWIRDRLFDLVALRHEAQRVDAFADAVVLKEPSGTRAGRAGLEILLVVPLPTSLRLDRLLAGELGLSRSRLRALHAAGRLRAGDGGAAALRRPIADGMRLELDFDGRADS